MRWVPEHRHSNSEMCSTMKLLFISLLLAGVAVVSPTNERAKRYAQQEGSGERNFGASSSPLQGIINRIFRSRTGDRNSSSTSRYPLRDWLTNIGQQRNGSMILDQLLKRINETWRRGFSSSNTAVPSRNIQLLRELFRLRNTSNSDVQGRIDAQLRRFFSDLRQRLSSNMNISSQHLRELRDLIRQRMELRLSEDRQMLQSLLQTIRSILSQRTGTISPRVPQTSGGGSISAGSGGASTSGSGSASGSAESGDRSGGASSGSGESGSSS